MRKILVISDNDILNQLYVTNLEVYLGAEVTLSLEIKNAKILLNENVFNIVICSNTLNEQDATDEIYAHLAKLKSTTKLIFIGTLSKQFENVLIIPNSYHLQKLVKSCAEILGVTAKEMAEKTVPKYYPVEIKFLSKIKTLPCNLFLKLKDNEFTLIGKKNDTTLNSTTKIQKEGIKTLYVDSLDRLLIVNQISEKIVDFLQASTSENLSVKGEALKTGFEFASHCFNQTPAVTAEIVNLAKACTKVMDEMVNEAPSLKKLLQHLNSNRDGYIYVHSILAAFVSNHIIRRVSWGGDSHIEKINFVLFFHDIMLTPIYSKYPELTFEEDLIFSEKLNDKEKELVLNHARLAAEAIISYRRAPIGADLLIKQHHGVTNGIGFAMDYKDDISPLSKIVIISEAFVEEFTKMKEGLPENQFNPKQILNTLNEKFKRPTYKKIIECLENFPDH
jgi:hypothetical protein